MIAEDFNMEFNYHEYPGDAVYVTYGFCAGMATRYFLIDGETVFVNNLAFCNIFINALKGMDMKDLTYDVGRNCTVINQSTSLITMYDDIKHILKCLFDYEITEIEFNKAKDITIQNFEKIYKNGEFRGWYKAFEIADLNKNYSLKQLIQDMKEITYKSFILCKKNVIVPNNMCVYVNGNIKDLKDNENDDMHKFYTDLDQKPIKLYGNVMDPYLRMDSHVLELSRNPINISTVCFSFDQKLAMLDRWIYMNIETNKLPYQDGELEIDEYDASYVVNEPELTKLKSYFKNCATKEQYDEARTRIIAGFSELLNKYPDRFGREYIKLKLANINAVELLQTLISLDYASYLEIATKIRPIITEAQVVMRR